ncbi:hypothetical protein R6Z07F_016004 [Ovis aries]
MPLSRGDKDFSRRRTREPRAFRGGSAGTSPDTRGASGGREVRGLLEQLQLSFSPAEGNCPPPPKSSPLCKPSPDLRGRIWFDEYLPRRCAGPRVPEGRRELFIGRKILDVPATRSARAVVQCYPSSARAPRPSSSSSRPSSLKPWQRRGITFPLSSGHFALALVPPSDPEPRGRNLHRGAPESVEPATAQRGEIRSRVVNAAGPRPRHLLSETSRRETRVAPAALRLPGLARAVRPDRLGL